MLPHCFEIDACRGMLLDWWASCTDTDRFRHSPPAFWVPVADETIARARPDAPHVRGWYRASYPPAALRCYRASYPPAARRFGRSPGARAVADLAWLNATERYLDALIRMFKVPGSLLDEDDQRPDR